MSTPEIPYTYELWRERAKIDYFPLFVPLWFSLNAWMRGRFKETKDRSLIELMKQSRHPLYDEFAGLMQSSDARGSRFRGNLGELHRALVSANITYEGKHKGKIVTLGSCAINWTGGRLESVLQENAVETVPNEDSDISEAEVRQNLELDSGLWVENNPERLFAAYVEIVYQVRCALFHGELAPTLENERVIRHLYLTLSEVMETV